MLLNFLYKMSYHNEEVKYTVLPRQLVFYGSASPKMYPITDARVTYVSFIFNGKLLHVSLGPVFIWTIVFVPGRSSNPSNVYE